MRCLTPRASLRFALLSPGFCVVAALASTAAPAKMSTASAHLATSRATIEGLEPARLWEHFAALSAVPRMSKHEGGVLEMLKGIARAKGLACTQDAAGNLLVKAPGRGLGVDAPPVMIQGHVDMVTEKNKATAHDFLYDPITLLRSADGLWIKADGTTLGADNGIGVSAGLALLDEADPIDLPPLELLFTVDEETGLNGAKALDAKALGVTAKTLLNLDTEEWGCIYIGCAGGGDAKLALPVARAAAGDETAARYEVRVEGLLGGHSGICIGDGRANAVQLAARTALEVLRCTAAAPAALIAFDGGDKHNAIPREASAILSIPASAEPAARAAVEAMHSSLLAEYGILETKGSVSLRPLAAEEGDWRGSAMPLLVESAERILNVLVALPHGPLKFSHAVPGLVETSNNVAAVTTDGPVANGGECVRVLCSSRSSVGEAMAGVREKLSAIGGMMGKGKVEFSPAYPGWRPNISSKVLELTKAALAAQLTAEGSTEPPQVLAVHAGLECGLIGEKCAAAYGGGLAAELDMISFGPTIRGAHSPDEAVEISTVPKFYRLTKAVLAELAAARA